MADLTDVEAMFSELLAQTQKSFSTADIAEIRDLIAAGNGRAALETLCRIAAKESKPFSFQARALVFKIADRLGVRPETLGLLG